ncbi:MAG: hypothetical protein KC493_08640 [Bacteriovoracaceae bacterium]|nr:hypothetical protein [Bacteriovoracaceae bacterium]
MRNISSSNILWLLSSMILTIISLLVFKADPAKENSQYYLIFNLIYLVFVFGLWKLNKINPKPLSISVYLMGVVTILFTQPIFENDHYRYLWEGRAILSSENPYVHPPKSNTLDHIQYDARDKIGFPELTTVYPPVSLVWFGLGGVLSEFHRVGLVFLMVLNSVLVFFLLRKLESLTGNSWLIFLIFPFLQKEFIQSIHVDLFAFSWVLLFLLNKKMSFIKSAGLIFMSIFSKVIGVFFVYPLALKFFNSHKSKPLYWLTLIFLLLSFPLFYWALSVHGGVGGFEAFSGKWVWNPGFYSIMWRGLGLFDHQARQISISLFLVFVAILGIWSLRKYYLKGFVLTNRLFWTTTYLFFAGLIFFSPVYNAWYAIWFIIPAILLNLRFGVLYGFLSFTCYTSYWNGEILPWTEFLGHFFFIPSLIECWISTEEKA